jgi:hypothetical protein
MPMDEKRARKILGEVLDDNGGLTRESGGRISWCPADRLVRLDGEFTPEMLEAVAWWAMTFDRDSM